MSSCWCCVWPAPCVRARSPPRHGSSLLTRAASTVGPAVAPIAGILVEEFHTEYTEVSKWSGWQFWAAGIAGLLASAVSRCWGKRPVYQMSILLCFVGAVWNARATSAESFLVSRVIQGLGLGAFETIVPSSIGDMYFVRVVEGETGLLADWIGPSTRKEDRVL